MTVGKIYCAKLIYENYKHLKKQGKDSFKVNIFFLIHLFNKNMLVEMLNKFLYFVNNFFNIIYKKLVWKHGSIL